MVSYLLTKDDREEPGVDDQNILLIKMLAKANISEKNANMLLEQLRKSSAHEREDLSPTKERNANPLLT